MDLYTFNRYTIFIKEYSFFAYKEILSANCYSVVKNANGTRELTMWDMYKAGDSSRHLHA